MLRRWATSAGFAYSTLLKTSTAQVMVVVASSPVDVFCSRRGRSSKGSKGLCSSKRSSRKDREDNEYRENVEGSSIVGIAFDSPTASPPARVRVRPSTGIVVGDSCLRIPEYLAYEAALLGWDPGCPAVVYRSDGT